jgi:hypothetical protein
MPAGRSVLIGFTFTFDLFSPAGLFGPRQAAHPSVQLHHMLGAHAQPFSLPATHLAHPTNSKVADIIDINCC